MLSVVLKYVLCLVIATGTVGVVAAHMGDNPMEAMDTTLRHQVRIVRQAIQHYHDQHGSYPGKDGNGDLGDHLCWRTDRKGMVGEGPEFHFGPYLSGTALPENPFVRNNFVKVVAIMPSQPDGRSAWIYSPRTGEFRANTLCEADGHRHFDF